VTSNQTIQLIFYHPAVYSFLMHAPKLPIIDIKKYGGKQIAIANGKIVATGKNSVEAFKKAQQRLPEKNMETDTARQRPKRADGRVAKIYPKVTEVRKLLGI